MAVRDWTIGVDIANIVGVAEGDAANNEAMAVIATNTGVYSGSDIMTLNTLSFNAVAAGANLRQVIYVSPGKFAVTSENGKVYELSFATPSSAPSAALVYEDPGAAPITAIAHAEGRSELVFSAENKVYTIPVGGGSATERADTETITSAGSELFDIDYSSQGWLLIIKNSDGQKATAIAAEDWSSTVSSNLPAALSDSAPLQVNYTEETAAWIVAREDGQVVTTTDLDEWRPAGDLWVAVGTTGHVAHSSDLSSWTTYQAPASSTLTNLSVSYGLDGSNSPLWLMGRTWDVNADFAQASDPTSGAGNWAAQNSPLQKISDAAYGNGVWIAVGREHAPGTGGIARSTDGGSTWTSPSSGLSTTSNSDYASVATDGAGNWVVIENSNRQYQVWKSTDNGSTWSLSTQWGWHTGIDSYRKEISYGNGVWILATHDRKIRTCTDAGLATNAWTWVATLSAIPYDIQHSTGGTWVAVGDNKKNWTSTDNGATWVENTALPGSSQHAVNVAYGNGTWVAVLNGANDNICKSTDNGTSWTSIGSTGTELKGVAFNSVLPNS